MSDVVIDDIKTTKKGRYALFCGGEFLFSVDEGAFCDFSLYKGCSLSAERLCELKELSDLNKARQRALRLLAVREHSKSELMEKLARHYDDETAACAADYAQQLGYLDDAVFAKRCVECVFEPKRFSARAARSYLREKGIEKELADEVLLAFADSEPQRLEELLSEKYINKLDTPKNRNAVYMALLRKGFSSDDIKNAFSKLAPQDFGEEE